MIKHKTKSQINPGEAAITIVKANIMAYVVTAIFILFSSIILTYADVDSKFESIIVITGIVASSFLAGFDTAKIDDRNGYKWGSFGGFLYFVLFLILGTVINKLKNISLTSIFVVGVVIIITSMVAGIISVNCNQNMSRHG